MISIRNMRIGTTRQLYTGPMERRITRNIPSAGVMVAARTPILSVVGFGPSRGTPRFFFLATNINSPVGTPVALVTDAESACQIACCALRAKVGGLLS